MTPIPAPSRPKARPTNGPTAQNEPVTRPPKNAHTTATREARPSTLGLNRARGIGCGAVMRVRPTGMIAKPMMAAAAITSFESSAAARPRKLCPAIMASSEIIEYTASTLPRRSGGAASLSQLSITMYRPAKANPVQNLSTSQAPRALNRPTPSSATVASAAMTMKVRMWATSATMDGMIRQPATKPRKYAEPVRPMALVVQPSASARIGSKVSCRPWPASRMATAISSVLTRPRVCVIRGRSRSCEAYFGAAHYA